MGIDVRTFWENGNRTGFRRGPAPTCASFTLMLLAPFESALADNVARSAEPFQTQSRLPALADDLSESPL